MKVQKYLCDYGDGDKVPYVIFPSGTVMFNPCGDWEVSRHGPKHIKDNENGYEFVGWEEAPCLEQI